MTSFRPVAAVLICVATPVCAQTDDSQIIVTGQAPESNLNLRKTGAGGALGNQSQLDTPFSTTIVSSEQMQNHQVHKLGDLFQTDASVSDNSDANSSWSTYVTVRGLALDYANAYKIDGRPFVSYGITLPYEMIEQVELLKGLSGFMYGFGSPGGIINYVTKKPTDRPYAAFDAGYWSDGVWKLHGDVGGRIGRGMFGYRVNAVHEEGETFNSGHLLRNAVSGTLDAHLTPDLAWYFTALYQERRAQGQTPSIYTGGLTGGLPATIDVRQTRLSSRDQHLNTSLQFYTTGLTFNFAPGWTASTNFSHSFDSRSRNETTLSLMDRAGDYSDGRYDGRETETFDQWQGMAQGGFDTGPFAHRLVAGLAWQRVRADYTANSFYQILGNGNIFDDYSDVHVSDTVFRPYHASTIDQKAIFASDTMTVLEHWSVLAGVRATNYSQHGFSPTGQLSSSYVEKAVVTPTVALMYRPRGDVTAYFSFVQSLEQGSIAGSTYANYGELLPPLRSRQYELGIKTDHAQWSATAALFRIERGAEYADGANRLVQKGQTMLQGIEGALSAHVLPGLSASGSVLLLDSSYGDGSGYDGNRVAGAPKYTATAELDYAAPFLPGLELIGGLKYNGAAALRPAGDIDTPGRVLFNLAGIFRTRIDEHEVTFRIAVDNLLNRRYWEYQFSDYIKPGDPRTFSLNAKVRL